MLQVKVLESLRHPNIVTFVEAFVTLDEQFLCIVMAYCESGDLAAQIKVTDINGCTGTIVCHGHDSGRKARLGSCSREC